MTSFLKIAHQFSVCEYFLLIPIDVPSLKLTEGQIKELQGVISNTPPPPRAENDQKSPGRIRLRNCLIIKYSFERLSLFKNNLTSEFHGSQGCLGSSSHLKTNTN